MTDLVLGIRLTADGQGLVGEVRLSREELEKLKESTEKAGAASDRAAVDGRRYNESLKGIESAARAAGLAIAAVGAALAVKTKQWIDNAAEMARWSEVTGKSVESLSALKFVADQSDVSFNTLMQTYQRLPRAIVEAFGENSEAGRAFKALAIDPRTIKANDEGMMLIVSRLRQVEDAGVRAALAQMIFKQRGEDLLLWVNQGAEGIQRLTKEGEYWATISGRSAEEAKRMKDNINTLTYATNALGENIASVVVPWVNKLIERMLEGTRTSEGFIGALQGLLTGTDLDKWEKDFSHAAEMVMIEQNRLDAMRTGRGGMRPGTREELTAQERAIAEARAEVERLQRIKPILVPEAPATGPQGQAPFAQPTPADLAKSGREGAGKKEMSFEELLAKNAEKRALMQEEAERAGNEAADRDRAREEKRVEEEQKRFEQRLAQNVANIELENMTEMELTQAHLDAKLAMLDQARAMDLIGEQMYNEQRDLLTVQAQAKMGNATAQGALARRKFEELNEQGKVQFVLGQMTQMTAGVATQSRALFNLHKAAALAEAIVSLPKGVALTYDSYPWPWNIIPAGIHLITGLARIQQIRSASFGGSSSPASIGGGTAIPVTPASGSPGFPVAPPSVLPQAAASRPRVDVTIIGADTKTITYKDMVEQFIPALNDALANGADLKLTFT